jgi:dihydroorotase
MRQVAETAAELGLPIFDHAEDAAFAGGVMNEGAVSRRLAVRGTPAKAEENIIERDIDLARDTGAKFLIQQVSTGRGAALIAKAKAQLGEDAICAETCPQYFILTEEAVADKGALAKMNPPLRTESDRRDVLSAILKKRGGLDVIASGHAPHTKKEKGGSLTDAPAGIAGLETCFPLSLTWLHIYCGMSLQDFSHKLSGRPAQLLGLSDRGYIKEGFVADLALFDLASTFEIDAGAFLSKGKSSPFDGLQVKGRAVLTMRGGEVTFARAGTTAR